MTDHDSLGAHITRVFKMLLEAQACHHCSKFVPEGAGKYPDPDKYVRLCDECFDKEIQRQ